MTDIIDHVSAELLLHLASLVLYFVVFSFAADTLRDVPRQPDKTLRGIIRAFLILVMVVATVFGMLQIWWVMTNGPDAVSDQTAFAWLIFDWSNGLAYFAFVSAVRVFLKWRYIRPCIDAPPDCPRSIGQTRWNEDMPRYSDMIQREIDHIKAVSSKYLLQS